MKKKSREPRATDQGSSKHEAPNARFCGREQRGAWSRSFWPGALLIVLFCFSAFRARAQTNLPAPSGNRYLIILETSRSMEGRGSGTLQVLQQFLGSGMGGELRRGDSLGVWTYNSQLYTGRFPIQYWSPENQKSIVQKAMLFMQAQTCEKTGNFDIVFPTLEKVAKSSQLLTVILVSDGEQKIRGTGFDQEINKLYDQWRAEQSKAKMPFITILRSLAGHWTNFTVTASPWPVEMPPMPKLIEVAKAEKKPPPAKSPSAPLRSTNNLIISGKKIAESRAAASNTLSMNPTQIASSAGPVGGSPISPPPGTRSSPGIANETPAPSVASAIPTTSLVQPASSSPVPVRRSEVISAAPAPPPVQLEKNSVTSPRDSASVNPPPVPQVVSGKMESEPEIRKVPVTEAPPVPAQVTEARTSVWNAEQNSKTDLAAASATRPGPNKRVPTDATVAVVQHTRFNTGTKLAISGLVLFIGIGAIAFLWAQRARSAKHASLITRSLDRK